MQPTHSIRFVMSLELIFFIILTLVSKDLISNRERPLQLFRKITSRRGILLCSSICLLFFLLFLYISLSLGVRDSLDMFLVNCGFEFVDYLQYHFQCGLRQLIILFFNFLF